MAQICQFYLKGNCRFGDNCRNIHPDAGGQQAASQGNRFGNRTAVFGKNVANGTSSGNSNPSGTALISTSTIQIDLTSERPQWPYSSYGAGKNEPNLLSGLDYSYEEIRLQYYELKGGEAYFNAVKNLDIQVNNATQSVLRDLNGAMREVERLQKVANGNKEMGIFAQNSIAAPAPATGNTFGSGGGFGSGSGSAFGSIASSVFGSGSQVPAFGTSTNGFGVSAFGSSAPATSGFGSAPATSAFGSTPATTFGSTPATTFGSAATTAVGSAAPTSAFGNTQATPAFGVTSFGAPQAPSTGPSSFSRPAPTPAQPTVEERALPADVLAAFQADKFQLGKIPEQEPPMSLR